MEVVSIYSSSLRRVKPQTLSRDIQEKSKTYLPIGVLFSNLNSAVEVTRNEMTPLKTNLSRLREILHEVCDALENGMPEDSENNDGNNNSNNLQDCRSKSEKCILRASNDLLQIREQIDLTCKELENTRLLLNSKYSSDSHKTEQNIHSSAILEDTSSQTNIDKENGNHWKAKQLLLFKNPKNKFSQTICCVIVSDPTSIDQADLQVYASDTDYDLAKCLESNDEQILSCLVSLQPKTRDFITFNSPTLIYIPVIPDYNPKLVPKIKFLQNKDDIWRHVETVQDLMLPGQQDIILHGAEVCYSNTERIQCVAVAVPPTSDFEVSQDGGIFSLDSDKNVELMFSKNTFNQTSKIKTKIKNLTTQEMVNASEKYLELENIKRASSLFSIQCSQKTERDVQITFHDLPGTETTEKKTCTDCKDWLLTYLDLELLLHHLKNVLENKTIEAIQNEALVEDKMTLFLTEVESVDENTFDQLKNVLMEINQQNVLERLSRYRDIRCESSSDFDPDFEQNNDTVRILSRTDSSSWSVSPLLANAAEHSAMLEKGHTSYNVVGLVVHNDVPESDLCRAASVLEDVSCLVNVSLIIRQNKDYPDLIAIHCIQSEKVSRSLSEMERKGYTIKPNQPLYDFGLVDGEQVEISFDNFCLEGYETKPFTMTYYSGLDVAKYSGRLCVLCPEQLTTTDRFTSKISFRVVSSRITIQRSGSTSLHLPKPMDDQIGYFCYNTDFQEKALAKYLAWKLTLDNSNSTRWIKHAKQLTSDTVYQYIRNQIAKDLHRPSERQRCEAFIDFWVNHYVLPHENKIERMVDIFGDDCQNKSEAHLFIRPFLVSGTLSNEGLRILAKSFATKWEVMARKLGINPILIEEIRNSQDNQIRQCLKMLDSWRLSDAAIKKGTDLVKHLHECAKAAKCSSTVLKKIVGF